MPVWGSIPRLSKHKSDTFLYRAPQGMSLYSQGHWQVLETQLLGAPYKLEKKNLNFVIERAYSISDGLFGLSLKILPLETPNIKALLIWPYPILHFPVKKKRLDSRSAVQCNVVHCSIVQYNIVHCNTVQYSILQCIVGQCSTV